MTKLPVEDISIHAVLGTWERYEYNKLDNASVGVLSFVENGVNQDFVSQPGLWPTYVRGNPITSFVIGFRIAANGGYMKGHYFMQYWGDPTSYEDAGRRTEERPTAQVVHDADTGRVHHVHRRIELGGPDTDAPLLDPLDLARKLGHQGNLVVLDVPTGELVAGASRVDLRTRRLVPHQPS